MTIPSRPAPAPPQQQTTQQQNGGGTNFAIKLPPPPSSGSTHRSFNSTYNKSATSSSSSKTYGTASSSSVTRHFPAARYAPATDWDGSPFELSSTNAIKKIAPPRPPPPRLPANNSGSTVLKKPGPPQSVNVLSNLFGRKRSQAKNNKEQQHTQPQQQTAALPPTKMQLPLPITSQINYQSTRHTGMQATLLQPTGTNDTNDVELIKFDSPPSSPTFTQKSNSDCVSVDSFSSDSNFSSPHNGSVSQPESGFEDDFTSPSDPWDSFNSAAATQHHIPKDLRLTQPVRNLNAINRNQNENPLCNGKSLLPPQEALAMPTIIRPKTSLNSSSNYYPSPVHSSFNNRTITSQSSTLLGYNSCETMPYAPSSSSQSSHQSLDTVSSLPMPSCPPPPPPANILDVINGQVDAINLSSEYEDSDGPSYGIALFNFEGVEDGDLDLKENEKVYLLQRLNDEWYLGRNRRGCEGIFPSNYVEVKKPLQDNASANNYSKSSISSISTNSSTVSHHKIRAMYNFNAEAPEDLSLKENDLVTVISRINDEWLYGQIGYQRGQFPANFIEFIPENLPEKMP